MMHKIQLLSTVLSSVNSYLSAKDVPSQMSDSGGSKKVHILFARQREVHRMEYYV